MGSTGTRPGIRAWQAVAGMALAFALAALIRSLWFGEVFLADGTVVFAAGDAYYHARRAL